MKEPGISKDVDNENSGRHDCDRALQEYHGRLANILEKISDGFLTLDNNLNVTFFNRAAECLLGRKNREVLYSNFFKAFPEFKESVFEENISAAFKEKKSITFVTNFEVEPYQNWYDVRIYPYENGIAIYFQIITEQKQLEEKLRQSQRLEAVGRLAGGIAHDFNNLLTIILGYSDLIAEEKGLSKSIREDIQEIKTSALKATSLTQQLLAFSRKQILHPEVLNLNDLLRNLEKMLKRLIGEDINLISKYDPELGMIKADPGQIEQVVLNLAINARDAMPQGGRLVIEARNEYLDESYSRKHFEVESGNYILLSVSDSGEGMDDQTKEHIFEPFFTTKSRDKGTGLGLSTVYGIIKQSGGYIWVYSELNHGSVFKIYLPCTEQNRVTRTETAEKIYLAEGTETILVVEDEEALRGIICKTLRNLGYRVLEAANGLQALSYAYEAAQNKIKLLITDVVMPEMSGRELVDQLKLKDLSLKVLYISGYTDDAIIRHGVLAEEVAFLQKPFSSFTLAQRVRELIDEEL